MADMVAVPPSSDAVAEVAFKTAMRQVASSVAIVTARLGSLRNGLTATAVCSVTASPATMLVCVNQNASAEPLICESRAFAINFLAEGQHNIARLFSTSKLEPEQRFSQGRWSVFETGSPMLEGTVASFECRVESRTVSGSHNIYVGRVVGVTSLDQDVLLYRNGSFRRLAPVG